MAIDISVEILPPRTHSYSTKSPYPLRFNDLNGVPETVKKIPILLQHKNPAPYVGMILARPLDSMV